MEAIGLAESIFFFLENEESKNGFTKKKNEGEKIKTKADRHFFISYASRSIWTKQKPDVWQNVYIFIYRDLYISLKK